MEVPQENSKWNAPKAASDVPALGRISGRRILHSKILYCAAVFVGLAAAVASGAAVAAAQEESPQITPGERRAPRKKDAEPRALALLRLSPDGKVSLVPIAILINGKFWDASVYKATPVPMALEPGTVYEAERTGSSIGLFTVNTALHSTAANAPIPWLSTGAWVPAGTDTGKKILQAESVPVGIDNGDAPPRLTKNPAASTNNAPSSAPSSSAPPSGSAPASTPSPSTPAPSGDEPPRLSKPSTAPPASTTPSTPAPGSTSPSETKPADSTPSTNPDSTKTDTAKADTPKPDAKKSDTAKPADSANTPASDSGAGEANRPRLRRGKPAESFADEDIPGYSKLGASSGQPAAATSAMKTAAISATGPSQLIPAISDSAGPEPHSYGFEWLKGEEGDRRQQLIALAEDQVRAYLDAQAKARIEPVTAPKAPLHHASAKKPAPPTLSNVQMTAYDLWSTNQPVVIFSAQAEMAPPPAGKAAAGASSALPSSASATGDRLQYSVLLVAYPDMYNNMHKIYVGVTDKYHLDLTPRLELIDAVDADGDGRGELLFRETTDAGTGWVVYRATADKLWKMYDSLNPE